MPAVENCLTVFTKPWREPGLEELAETIAELGFGGVELAVRPGYQVEPETAMERLPEAVLIFRERGLVIESVATELSERMVAACGNAGVPVLRTMLPVDPDRGYVESVERFQETARSLISAVESSGVKVGVQNHCDHFVGTAAGLMAALEPLPESFVAVLDLAHTTLCGEPVRYALEIVKPRLAMVNLKNAIRVAGPVNNHGELTWTRRWVGAKEGLTAWSEVVGELKRCRYAGPICLTAEYKDPSGNIVLEDAAGKLVGADLAHLRRLFDTV